MTQRNNQIYLNENSDSFEIINVSKEKSNTNSSDFRPLLKRIEAYKKEGWELVFNNVYEIGDISANYVLMRKERMPGERQ